MNEISAIKPPVKDLTRMVDALPIPTQRKYLQTLTQEVDTLGFKVIYGKIKDEASLKTHFLVSRIQSPELQEILRQFVDNIHTDSQAVEIITRDIPQGLSHLEEAKWIYNQLSGPDGLLPVCGGYSWNDFIKPALTLTLMEDDIRTLSNNWHDPPDYGEIRSQHPAFFNRKKIVYKGNELNLPIIIINRSSYMKRQLTQVESELEMRAGEKHELAHYLNHALHKVLEPDEELTSDTSTPLTQDNRQIIDQLIGNLIRDELLAAIREETSSPDTDIVDSLLEGLNSPEQAYAYISEIIGPDLYKTIKNEPTHSLHPSLIKIEDKYVHILTQLSPVLEKLEKFANAASQYSREFSMGNISDVVSAVLRLYEPAEWDQKISELYFPNGDIESPEYDEIMDFLRGTHAKTQLNATEAHKIGSKMKISAPDEWLPYLNSKATKRSA